MRSKLPDPFSTITGLDRETQTGSGYFFDNRKRGSPDEAVLQQTLSGEGFLDVGSTRFRVPSGCAMLFTHDESSAYGYPHGVTVPYRLHYVSFRLAGLRCWFERIRAEFGPVVRMAVKGEAADHLEELGRRFHAREFRDRFQETELLHQLLVCVYREQVAATATRDPIEFGHHYLRDNFRSPVNLKQVAARCGVSREHFIRAFSKRYREPPGELLRRMRLEHADRMLLATRLTIQDVALACGFADSNSFCRAFRMRFGKTPGAVRRS